MRIGFICALAVTLCASQATSAQGAKHFLQVELVKTIKAKKAKAGDVVKARAVQALVLAGGVTIPQGSTIVGEVRSVDEKSIAISFDQAEIKGTTVPVKLSIRGAMMPGAAPMREGGSSAPVASSTPASQPMHGAAQATGNRTAAAVPVPAGGASEPISQPGHAVAAQTGSVIGMPGVTLEVDEGPQHASKFTTADKELQLKSGLQLMLAVVE